MAFEGLSEKLNNVFRKLKSRGKLTESDIKDAMREVRLALLEADVSYKCRKGFLGRLRFRKNAVGNEVSGKSYSGTAGNKNSKGRTVRADG